jgi:APA family basic amino acid/polyamine antiporter
MEFKRELSLFDMVNIVVGSVIGADIYIASALTAGLIGPFSIMIWVIAAILATIIAIIFAYCSYYVPQVGGPYAYVSKAFGNFYGFLAGWSLWIAEMLALPVFAIAFVRYLQNVVSMSVYEEIILKGIFILALTAVNIAGVRAAGKVNDLLTMLKLIPLLILILGGFAYLIRYPGMFIQNYTPLAPLGFSQFGAALVIVFWAYVGFELGTLPAAEVKDPQQTIPRAIIIGMAVCAFFFIAINFVVFGVVNWTVLATNATPLILAGVALFGMLGGSVMLIGALLSVTGTDESVMLGTARLSYAMSIDGLFPRLFARIHPKYGTPVIALIVQGIVAFLLSIYSDLTHLISFAIFNLGFVFLLTSCALIVLKNPSKKNLPGQTILPWIGILISLYLMFSTSWLDKILGGMVILAGIPLYLLFSPKQEIRHLKEEFLSEESVLLRQMHKENLFLANFIRILHKTYHNIRRSFE